MDEAFRISPADGATFLWKNIAALAKLYLGENEEAVELFREAIDASRNYPLNHFYIAAALAALGRQGEAETELKTALGMSPDFTLSRFRAGAESDNPVFLTQRERVIEAMKKAGVRE